VKMRLIRSKSDITPDLILTVKKLAAAGCTFEQVSEYTQIAKKSLMRWMACHYNEGKAQAIGRAGSILYNAATGDPAKGILPDPRLLMFYLKAVAKWNDSPKNDIDDVAKDKNEVVDPIVFYIPRNGREP